MKRTILSTLFALYSIIFGSFDEEYKPEFKVVHTYHTIGNSNDGFGLNVLTSLYCDGTCYYTGSVVSIPNKDECQKTKGEYQKTYENAKDFYQFDEMIILATDNEEEQAHKLEVLAMQEQIKRFFRESREEAEEILDLCEVKNEDLINTYIDRRFKELFKITKKHRHTI